MTQQQRKSVYQVITDRVIQSLQEGQIPWQKPWKSGNGSHPKNAITGKHYHGVNVFLLLSTNYTDQLWATYKQYDGVGAKVRKGEKGEVIVYWNWSYFCPECGKVERKDVTQMYCNKCGSKVDNIPMLRYYTVFNIAQVEGLPEKYLPVKSEPVKAVNPIKAAEKIIKGFKDKPETHFKGDRAFYRPSTDEVTVPVIEDFNSPEEFYSTLFHEYVHSTGHEKRVGRDLKGWFGDQDYSKEELVAEMGATFLCAEAGIMDRVFNNSKAYIQSWISKLQSNPKWIVFAASQAEKAATHIIKGKAKTAKVAEAA